MKQDIRKAFDTVRCQDGLKERTRSHVLGRMRQRQPKPAMHRMKLIVSLACLLVFAGSGFGGYQLYYAEAATISIDVNPSIELGINRWGRVIEEVPYGRDGETVLREVSLRHLEYEEALERLIGSEAMQDYLKKDGKSNTSSVVNAHTPGAKKARLSYEVLGEAVDAISGKKKWLLRIHLDTGRHHQIRVQMAHAGMPLAGDRKYGAGTNVTIGAGSLALCAASLTFLHPVTGKVMKFVTKPEGAEFKGISIPQM